VLKRIKENMNPQFSTILFYGLVAGLATVAGIYLVLFKEAWARKNSIYLISFSAGVLLSTAIAHLLPESQELNTNALIWLLLSFVLFYILEHGIILHSCGETGECEVHPVDKIAMLGIGFHSLLDGIVIGVGFEISFALGIIATLSVLLHEVPEGISTVSILLHSGYTRKKAILFSWIVALATPVGAILAVLLLNDIQENVLGALLAVAAGSFLYVAASDLIPEIHRQSKLLNIVLVIFGVAFPFIIRLVLG